MAGVVRKSPHMEQKPLKIALLVKRFHRSGGKERYVVELAQALGRRGHEIHVYACHLDHSLLTGMTGHQVPSRLRFSSVLNTLSFIRETQKMIPEKAFDIIHSHERNFTQPIVTLHSLSFLEGIEKYSFLRKIDQKYLSLRSLLYLWLEKQQMRSPWLISVSREVSRDVTRYYSRASNMVTIPPGVDTDQFSPSNVHNLRKKARAENRLAPNEVAVLFVGSAFQRKGLDRILPFIKGNMRLFVVGKGDKLARYKRLIRAYGIENNVVFTGMVHDVLKYYALADIVVLPSRSEAFGMSILEGMACGLPVIVSANSGVADLIDHNENGLLMKEDSALGDYFLLLQSEKERARLGERARATAEAYSWERVGITHEQFYYRILS